MTDDMQSPELLERGERNVAENEVDVTLHSPTMSARTLRNSDVSDPAAGRFFWLSCFEIRDRSAGMQQ
jgi:hypothetical protein